MGHTQNEPGFVMRRPWNDGRMVGAKKPLKPKDVWAIRVGLALSKRTVNLRADSNAIEHRFVAIGNGRYSSTS